MATKKHDKPIELAIKLSAEEERNQIIKIILYELNQVPIQNKELIKAIEARSKI